jgi:hypothetical protein
MAEREQPRGPRLKPAVQLPRFPATATRASDARGERRRRSPDAKISTRGQSVLRNSTMAALQCGGELLAEFAGIRVAKCCEVEDRLRCCFEVGGDRPR